MALMMQHSRHGVPSLWPNCLTFLFWPFATTIVMICMELHGVQSSNELLVR